MQILGLYLRKKLFWILFEQKSFNLENLEFSAAEVC